MRADFCQLLSLESQHAYLISEVTKIELFFSLHCIVIVSLTTHIDMHASMCLAYLSDTDTMDLVMFMLVRIFVSSSFSDLFDWVFEPSDQKVLAGSLLPWCKEYSY